MLQLTAYADPLAEHLYALIEALPDAVYFKDGGGRWRVANTTGLRLLDLHGHAWGGKADLESEIDRTFNPFASSKAEGLGLGLTICRSIVESYGGRIRVSSTPDSGSISNFTLPLESHV